MKKYLLPLTLLMPWTLFACQTRLNVDPRYSLWAWLIVLSMPLILVILFTFFCNLKKMPLDFGAAMVDTLLIYLLLLVQASYSAPNFGHVLAHKLFLPLDILYILGYHVTQSFYLGNTVFFAILYLIVLPFARYHLIRKPKRNASTTEKNS